MKPEPPRQLAFDLPLDPRFGREDFLVSPSNERAYGLVEAWPDWPDTAVVLTGPPGSGKSHLASIWATRAHAWAAQASTVMGEGLPHLVSAGALVVEDVDRPPLDEPALFHLLNLARERRASVLLTGTGPVDAWPIKTLDLRSRLRLATTVAIEAPDDALLKAVLVKLFIDRQLVVDTSVVDTLALRIERSLARAAEIVTALDREALSRGRRVTRAMATELLARLTPPEESE